MRIAQIAPLYESVPPSLYGGTERVVAHLSNALVRRGHDVTLFASGDSRTDAELVSCRDVALRLDKKLSWDVPAHLSMLAEVRARASEFDVLHFHLDCLHFPFFTDIADHTLTTLHGRQDLGDLRRLHEVYRNFPLVSISDSQRQPLPDVHWMRTIHHGFPTSQYRFSARPKGRYLAFLGRIAPEKGVDRAVAIARAAGIPLKVAAKIDVADRDYFGAKIAPLFDGPGVEFVGEIAEAEKSEFLGNALALLFPINWPEPFGLVMIESMACGTPVIAFNRGSVPEVIENGISGFVVQSIEQAVTKVAGIGKLSRYRVRREFERRFSVDVMASKYEETYASILGLRRRVESVRFRAAAPTLPITDSVVPALSSESRA